MLRSALLFIAFLCFGCSSEEPIEEIKTGGVVFYVTEDFECGEITVSLDNLMPQSTSKVITQGIPKCEDETEIKFENIEYGMHSYRAEAIGGCTWEGSINLDFECASVPINQDNFAGNLCEWDLNVDCFEKIRVEEQGTCGLNPAYIMYFRHNCADSLVFVICQNGEQNLPSSIFGAIAPNEEVSVPGCQPFDDFDYYTLPDQYYKKFVCPIPDCN